MVELKSALQFFLEHLDLQDFDFFHLRMGRDIDDILGANSLDSIFLICFSPNRNIKIQKRIWSKV